MTKDNASIISMQDELTGLKWKRGQHFNIIQAGVADDLKWHMPKLQYFQCRRNWRVWSDKGPSLSYIQVGGAKGFELTKLPYYPWMRNWRVWSEEIKRFRIIHAGGTNKVQVTKDPTSVLSTKEELTGLKWQRTTFQYYRRRRSWWV